MEILGFSDVLPMPRIELTLIAIDIQYWLIFTFNICDNLINQLRIHTILINIG